MSTLKKGVSLLKSTANNKTKKCKFMAIIVTILRKLKYYTKMAVAGVVVLLNYLVTCIVESSSVTVNQVTDKYFKCHNERSQTEFYFAPDFTRSDVIAGINSTLTVSNFTAKFARLTAIRSSVLEKQTSGKFTWNAPFNVEKLRLPFEHVTVSVGDGVYHMRVNLSISCFALVLRAILTHEPARELDELQLEPDEIDGFNFTFSVRQNDTMIPKDAIKNWIMDYVLNEFTDIFLAELTNIVAQSMRTFQIWDHLFP